MFKHRHHHLFSLYVFNRTQCEVSNLNLKKNLFGDKSYVIITQPSVFKEKLIVLILTKAHCTDKRAWFVLGGVPLSFLFVCVYFTMWV